ncbi:sensor histidine kinase [uncultured Winogradskyella sp.]|uniref:sensor histidine kinase n=1 Tax=uncultured Winogradskyella sp. TaxID=395353 RepID=UPI002628CB09|nr:histidine kinase [uncultured Winogradskyella sp.]|tara:strand:+ start:3859 stop:4806 length:948 start_codon:yes stop_codon:yes gene_type:complete
MRHNKLFKTAGILSGIIIVLMVLLRNTQSEIFAVLTGLLGLMVFYTILYYLFQTEKVKFGASNPIIKYIFYGISIPLLIYGVQVTTGTDGFLKEGIRILLAFEISYIIFYWIFKYRKNIQKLKSDKLEAELMLLKNQINPHFFFNTLNNLYSLIKKDADAAQDYVLKLSDLMRFTIYDSGKESVKLKDEIDYLINFIDLQTARYHKNIDINFEKNINNSDSSIAPLLFINLLENAFKHGVEKATENAFVHIKLIEDDKKISFTVKNNYDAEESSENIGIGLKNLKDRLNLLYPNKHQLCDNIEENIYSTTLEIYK